MKKLDKFILQTYLAPFFRAFGISLFLLVLQFMSRYKDQLFGKGLEAWVIIKIFLFASSSLIVLALPVSVLISSLMAMGSMGEYYELTSIRACGIPLPRVLRPMFVATLLIAGGSFLMSVYVVPAANLKLYSLLYDVKEMKPAFSLKPGHFNAAIDGYVIRIEDRDMSTEMLYDIMIYDHTYGRGNGRAILADSGKMVMSDQGDKMLMSLYRGVSYEALMDEGPGGKILTYSRFYYDTLRYGFDMSAFAMKQTPEEAFSSHHYMLNIGELATSMDSIQRLQIKLRGMFAKQINSYTKVDSFLIEQDPEIDPKSFRNPDPLRWFPRRKKSKILNRALSSAKQIRASSEKAIEILHEEDKSMQDFLIEYHSKFSLPVACLLFLFIGAPLGAIVRKGGVGIPIIVGVVFFMIFYVMMLQAKKMAREGILSAWMGVWLPVLIFAPLALIVTYETTANRSILSNAFWYRLLKPFGLLFNFFNVFKKKKRETPVATVVVDRTRSSTQKTGPPKTASPRKEEPERPVLPPPEGLVEIPSAEQVPPSAPQEELPDPEKAVEISDSSSPELSEKAAKEPLSTAGAEAIPPQSSKVHEAQEGKGVQEVQEIQEFQDEVNPENGLGTQSGPESPPPPLEEQLPPFPEEEE